MILAATSTSGRPCWKRPESARHGCTTRAKAATTLLFLGVPERAVMDLMGWSNAAIFKRYAHVTPRLRRDIADRLNTFLWALNETKHQADGA